MIQENNSRRDFLLTGLLVTGLVAGCSPKKDPFEAAADGVKASGKKIKLLSVDGEEIEAFRLREKDRRYPYIVLHHYRNKIKVCSTVCSERVSMSWENPKNMELRKNLFKEICTDLADNAIKVALAMKEVRSPSKKKR